VLLTRALASELDHLLDAVVHEVDGLAGLRRESLVAPEQRRVQAMGEPRQQAVHDQLVILIVRPGLAGLLPEHRLEFGEAAVLLQPALKRRHLQVAAVAGILQHLVVEDGGHLGQGRAGDLLAGEIEHDHCRREPRRDSGKQRLRLCPVQSVLQMPQEGLSIDLYRLIECETEIFGERALARAVEAGDPHSDLMAPAGFHRRLDVLQQSFELILDAVGDDILGDFRLQPLRLRRLVGDHLLDRAVDAAARVEEGVDLGHTLTA